MLIDWFTVAAQIVNFLIVVWLLKRFLYGRILRAIDARESRIANQIAEATAKESKAQEQFALYQAKLNDWEQRREGMLADARLDAEQQHAQLLEQARDHVRCLEAKWQEDLDRDRQNFLLDLRRRAATEILAISRRVVADLTCMELEECAIQVFLQKIRSLDHDAWSRFGGADLQVRSPMNIAEAQRVQIARTVEEQLGRPVQLRFEQASDVGLGLELRGNGWRIGWNSDTYLQALEEDLNEALNQSSGPGAMAAKAR